MSYNNNYRRADRSQGQQGPNLNAAHYGSHLDSKRDWREPQYREYNPSYRPQKKHSGSKYHTSDKECISGWNASKQRGFITLIASPITDSGLQLQNNTFGTEKEFEVTSKSGRVYERWFAKIENKTTGQTIKASAFFYRKELKLYIPKMGLVASTKKDYFGKSTPPRDGK